MNSPQFMRAHRCAAAGCGGLLKALAVLSLAVFAWTGAHAQVQVKTLAGGPIVSGGPAHGYVDGDALQLSQFNEPEGLALDQGGRLYVADRANGRIRILDQTANKARTLLSGLKAPVDLAIDAATNFYVLTAGDGQLAKYDRFGNPGGVLATGLVQPSAITLDAQTNAYIAELGGTVRRISPGGVVTLLVAGLNQPRGLAFMHTGMLAVSESGSHAIRLIDPRTSAVTTLSGGNGAGFLNGFAKDAKFNAPGRMSRAPNGSLVVADRLNHRVRIVDTNGIATTLFGIDESDWASDYPGWEDGSNEFAESRIPTGIAIARDGLTVFITEAFYHLVREVSGATLGGSVDVVGGGSTPDGLRVVLPPPTLSPPSGYHPMGQLVNITSGASKVFYTVDGSTPNTNSFQLALNGGLGQVLWQDGTRDLRSLRLMAVDGTNASPVVAGSAVQENQIGIPRDLTAGPGSVAIVPVVLNLRTNIPVKSIQYRVEVTPSAGAPVISDLMRALPISQNDFIPVVTGTESQGPSRFSFFGYGDGNPRGLAITFIGTNANFSVRDFAVVGMLSIPIPRTAEIGAQYSIRVLQVSATTDAQQGELLDYPIVPMPAARIVVASNSILVGDSARSRWYNAEGRGAGAGDYGFGDNQLLNSDVNNVFLASFGLKTPYAGSDLFVAMDAYPEDTEGAVGGDGQIRFLDWQVILERSLGTEIPAIGMHTNLWRRTWVSSVGLSSVSDKPFPKVAGRGFARTLPPPPGGAWYRNASLRAVAVENAVAGTIAEVPVELNVAPGSSISGLQFRAQVIAVDGAPEVKGLIEFRVGDGLPRPILLDNPPAGEVGCAWSLFGDHFIPALTGQKRLGFVRFQIPAFARSGHCYSIRFNNLDGSPLPADGYEFETFPGCVWVHSAALREPARVSDEWRLAYFAGIDDSSVIQNVDSDDDGVPNADEFLAGTDPRNAQSLLRVSIHRSGTSSGSSQAVVRWTTSFGRIYYVESSVNLVDWKVIASSVPGDGRETEVALSHEGDKAQYYRVRLAP